MLFINTLILFHYIYVELQLLFDRVYIVVPGSQEYVPDGLQAIAYLCVLAWCGHGLLQGKYTVFYRADFNHLLHGQFNPYYVENSSLAS